MFWRRFLYYHHPAAFNKFRNAFVYHGSYRNQYDKQCDATEKESRKERKEKKVSLVQTTVIFR